MPAPFLGPVVLGGLTTLVGNFFINRQQQIAAEREFRASELKMANKVFDEVSTSMDALAQSSMDVMWALVLRPDREKEWRQEDLASWETYTQTRASWNKSRSRNLALTKKYFGENAADDLVSIQEDLDDLEQRINSNYFDRTQGEHFMVNKGTNKKAMKSKGIFIATSRRLRTSIVALSEFMIDKIQKQEVGALTTSNI